MKQVNILPALFACLFTMSSLAQDVELSKAEKYFEKYSFDTAAEEYEEVNRKTTAVLRNLAESYMKLHEYNLAVDEFDLLMKREDKTADDILNYSEVLMKLGKYESAQSTMEVYYELRPEDSRARAHHSSRGYFKDLLKDKGQFKVKNIDLNSEQEDFGTSFYKGKVVFASSRGVPGPVKRNWNWNRLPFLDLYIANEGRGASISDLERFKKINKKYHEGPAAFDEKGEFMVFTRNNYDGTDKNGVRRLKLFESDFKDGQWTEEKPFPYNSDEYSVGHAALTEDGKTMYLASDMPGGIGGVDIYVSNKSEDGTWSEPLNMGTGINTEGDEMFPFIHPSGLFFFASDGHLGLGGLDILTTKIDTEGRPGQIKNLGMPLNTSRDDFALLMNADLKSGYFSSNRESGKGDDDIYYFELLKPITFGKRIEGVAIDKEGNALEKTVVSLMDYEGNVISSVTTGPDGAYSFSADDKMNFKLKGVLTDYFDGTEKTDTHGEETIVKADLRLEKDPGISLLGIVTQKKTSEPIVEVKVTVMDNLGGPQMQYFTDEEGLFRNPLQTKKLKDRISYNILLEKEGFLPKTVTYNKVLDHPGEYEVHSEMDLSMTKLEVGMDIGTAIDINPIYFDVNKFNIRPDASIELQKIVEVMTTYPTMVIELGSHTDCRASDTYNMELSDKRAKASADWIKQRVSGSDRIYGKGFGESRLVNHCACDRTDRGNKICSEEEHQANRRTEFRIVKM